jgi:sugar lactone lactonase YvrE
VAAAPDGTLYVSDYTTRAIYRIAPDRSVEEFARGTWLGRPNGLVLSDGQLLVADSQGKRIHELDESGQPLAERELPQGGFDGLVLLEDGTLLVASWDASAIYRLAPDGQVSELFGKITAPADIGLDTKRGLVLIPFFKHNRLEARPLP